MHTVLPHSVVLEPAGTGNKRIQNTHHTRQGCSASRQLTWMLHFVYHAFQHLHSPLSILWATVTAPMPLNCEDLQTSGNAVLISDTMSNAGQMPRLEMTHTAGQMAT